MHAGQYGGAGLCEGMHGTIMERYGSRILHRTSMGCYHLGDSKELVTSPKFLKKYGGKVQLIVTSPPYPLNHKKSYGNLKGELYKEWFVSLAKPFADLLTDDGSIVLELGNAWEPGRPVQSLLHLESLIEFVKSPDAGLRLCQQFICYNPSRLPSPAAWVTVDRIRTTDSFTHVWWMSKTDYPKADNRKVLRPYSERMKKLLESQTYNAGHRPSEHKISKTGFLKDHNGSIVHNVLEFEPIDPDREVRLPNVLSIANSDSNASYMRLCREKGIKPHPARMPENLASFFIEFLTDPGDLVLDPFAGSNTTGYSAERLGRRWAAIEIKEEYSEQSLIRLGSLKG